MSTLQLFTDVSKFDERAFLIDLPVIPFENVYNFSDPNVALSHWIDLFLDVINNPPKKNFFFFFKRVKHQTLIYHPCGELSTHSLKATACKQ